MSWASRRETTRTEDMAYCLMGIFEVNMPLLYGEGNRAFFRLQEEIMKHSNDHSLFAWSNPTRRYLSLLAPSPKEFQSCRDISNKKHYDVLPYSMTNMGIRIELPLYEVHPKNNRIQGIIASKRHFLAALNCSRGKHGKCVILLDMRDDRSLGRAPDLELRNFGLDLDLMFSKPQLEARETMYLHAKPPSPTNVRFMPMGWKPLLVFWLRSYDGFELNNKGLNWRKRNGFLSRYANAMNGSRYSADLAFIDKETQVEYFIRLFSPGSVIIAKDTESLDQMDEEKAFHKVTLPLNNSKAVSIKLVKWRMSENYGCFVDIVAEKRVTI